MKKLLKKDWILYEVLGNDGGDHPESLKDVNLKYEDPEVNKHVPFIIENNDGYTVKMGKNEYHPETEEHYTVFAQIKVDNMTYTKYFENGETPEFTITCKKGKVVEARAFCNLHGLFGYKLGA
ncbi:MAG: hypothetical protein NC236_02270 [Mycoplasma sp.]|nr:hypothetical protein [Mycoplasma sp.]